jgi:hypothetical protein
MFEPEMRKLYQRFVVLGVLLCALAVLTFPKGTSAENCNTCTWDREICYGQCPPDDWRFGYLCGDSCEEQYWGCESNCTDCTVCNTQRSACVNGCVSRQTTCLNNCAEGDTACQDACNNTESTCEQSCENAYIDCQYNCQ